MYFFEGKDYSKDPSSEDQKSFERLMEEQLTEFQKAAGEGRALRHKAGVRFSNFPKCTGYYDRLLNLISQ